MPRSTEAQLEALKKRKSQVEAQISALNARRQKDAKRQDTRRKVVAGAILLEHCEHDSGFKELVGSLLDRFLTRPVDRVLFAPDFGWPEPPPVPAEKPAKPEPATVKPEGGDNEPGNTAKGGGSGNADR